MASFAILGSSLRLCSGGAFALSINGSAQRRIGLTAIGNGLPVSHSALSQILPQGKIGVTSGALGTRVSSFSTFQPKTSNRRSVQRSSKHVVSEEGRKKKEPVGVSLYRSEGVFVVQKPFEWTSQDVVSYIRGILDRDAQNRGAQTVKVTKKASRSEKKRMLRVGHGGTLDPLATGVLVIGVGRGTKELQNYLSGSKAYRAGVELGYETSTLDLEGSVTKTASFEGITLESIDNVLSKFVGKIMQVPPVYSALKKDGKKFYEEARNGKSAEDLGIEAREVEVIKLELISTDDKGKGLPCFGLKVECGGGTYIRSLLRDIAYELKTLATMTSLVRTQQGPFKLEDALPKSEWNSDNIYAIIDKNNAQKRTH